MSPSPNNVRPYDIEQAHIIAGSSSLLLKIRTGTTKALQAVLRRIFDIHGVTGARTIVELESVFNVRSVSTTMRLPRPLPGVR